MSFNKKQKQRMKLTDELKKNLEELKFLFEGPRLFVENFFKDLKNQVNSNASEEQKTELIDKIELFEIECFKNIRPYDKVDIITIIMNYEHDYNFSIETKKNIQKIEEKIKQSDNIDLKEIQILIENEETRIKRYLFSNKTILFMHDFGWKKENFLMIIDDEYLSKNSMLLANSIPLTNVTLTNKNIKIFYLLEKLSNMKIDNFVEFNLNIEHNQELHLNGHNITLIDTNAFENFSNLILLNISCNNLKQVSPKMFNNLFFLKDLDLSRNLINLIHDNSFKDLEKLEKLNLWKNSFSFIYMNMFNGLTNLKELDLSENELNRIQGNSFTNLPNLIKLDLSINCITEISLNTFSGLLNLKELLLSDNLIYLIEENSFDKLPNLERLDLDNNKLDVDSNIFKNLNNLKYLNLDNNMLKFIERKKLSLLLFKKKYF